MNTTKSMFADTIANLSSDKLANECERYGMCWGCDSDCPVFLRGECKLDIEEIRDMITKESERFDISMDEILKLYPKLNKYKLTY